MTDDRRAVMLLDAELHRREQAEQRMAGSLVELEQHPGHRLLAEGGPTGATGRRWDAARTELAGLWRDFAVHRATVQAARTVRDARARPGDRELAELRRLLVAPSIEDSRTPVGLAERGLTGDAERVEYCTLGDIAERMERAFGTVGDLVVAVAAAHTAALAALGAVAERLVAARGLADRLGCGDGDPEPVALAALTDRVAELDATVHTDPLAFTAGPTAGALAALRAEVDAVAQRLTGYTAQRDRWDADLAVVSGAVDGLAGLRADAERTRQLAAELIATPLPDLPADPLPGLRQALAELDGAGWAARTTGLSALRGRLDAATGQLRDAHELATGLLDRRDELRGRFGAFRARAARLGHAEQASVLELEARIEGLLWTRPCDLPAATRALSAYQQQLRRAGDTAGGPDEQGGRAGGPGGGVRVERTGRTE